MTKKELMDRLTELAKSYENILNNKIGVFQNKSYLEGKLDAYTTCLALIAKYIGDD